MMKTVIDMVTIGLIKMTATSYLEFKKLFDRIPKDRLPYVHFIPLRSGTKVPIGNWKGKAHLSKYECKEVLKTGGNIAISGLPKGLLFLDIDRKEFPQGIPDYILNLIPKTFCVNTRSNGKHYYFLNDGTWNNQKFMLISKSLSILKDELVYCELGELRTNWQYVVAAGSWVEPQTYKICIDVPILEFKGKITKYFIKGNVRDFTPKMKPAPTEGKKGIPITIEHKILVDSIKQNREGKIEPSIKKGNLRELLKKRGYNVV